MKTTGACPKCGSRELLRIPGRIGAYGTGNIIQVGWSIYSHAKVTRFVCALCGYTEEWIDSPSDLEKLRKKFGG